MLAFHAYIFSGDRFHLYNTTVLSLFPVVTGFILMLLLLIFLVATGFPAGQTHLKTRLQEIHLAVADGAREIDIVINRQMVLSGDWKGEISII